MSPVTEGLNLTWLDLRGCFLLLGNTGAEPHPSWFAGFYLHISQQKLINLVSCTVANSLLSATLLHCLSPWGALSGLHTGGHRTAPQNSHTILHASALQLTVLSL